MWEQLCSPNSVWFRPRWQRINNIERNEKKDKPKIFQSFSIWRNENQELVLKEKSGFHWKRIDFECFQDMRKDMMWKWQDMTLKLWKSSEGEIELGIFSWERERFISYPSWCSYLHSSHYLDLLGPIGHMHQRQHLLLSS